MRVLSEMMPMTDAAFLDRLAAIVGPSGLVTGDELHGRSANWTRPTEPCAALALVRPRDTAETSAVRAACHAAGAAVVPPGGAARPGDGTPRGPPQAPPP